MPDTTRIPEIDYDQVSSDLKEIVSRHRQHLTTDKPTQGNTASSREDITAPAAQRIPGVDYDQVSKDLKEIVSRHRATLFPEDSEKGKTGEDLTLKAKENLQNRGEFTRGVLRGTDQLQGSLYGFAGLAGSAIGSDTVKDWGFENYKRNMEEAAENPQSVTFDELSIKEPLKAGTWAIGMLGELAPSMAEAALTALAGSAIGTAAAPGPGTAVGAVSGFFGRRAARQLIKDAAKHYVKKGIAKEAAQTLAKKEVALMAQQNLVRLGLRTFGAQAGLITGVMPLEAGGNWAEVLEETGIDNPVSALATGTAAAFLELAGGNARLIHKFLGPEKAAAFAKAIDAVDTKLIARMAKDCLIQGGAEYAQEAGQEFLSLVNIAWNDPTFELYSIENIRRLNEAGWAGFIGGTAGGAASAVRPNAKPATTPTIGQQHTPTPAPSAQTHTDMPLAPSNEASKTHVTEDQRQGTLDEKHDADVQKKAADLFDTITAEVAAENEALEKARAEEIARREAETAARAAQEQAEIDAAVTAAREQQATLKTTLAADNPQKQTIVDDVLSLTEKRLITALQKEMGITITPAGPNLYSIATPAGPAPANLFDLRQRLAQHRIANLDAKIAQEAAAEKDRREMEERRAAKKAEKDAAEKLAFARGFIARGASLNPDQIAFLEQNIDKLTAQEIAALNTAKNKPKTIPASVTLTTGLKKPQDASIIDEATNPDFQPTAPGEETEEALDALIPIMIADLAAASTAGLTHTDEGTTRHSAGVAWLTEANKRGLKADTAEASAILKKAQNNLALTPRQKEVFSAITNAAEQIYGMNSRVTWATKGFETVPGKKLETDELVEGDRFVIAEEEFRVTDIDDDGNVTMKDGTIRKVRQGSTIENVDYFKPNKEATSFDVEDKDLTPAAPESKIRAEKEKQYAELIETITAEFAALEAAGMDTGGAIRESARRFIADAEETYRDTVSRPFSEKERIILYSDLYALVARAAGITFKGWRAGNPIFAGPAETGYTNFEKTISDKSLITALKRVEKRFKGETPLDVHNINMEEKLKSAEAKVAAQEAKAAAEKKAKEEKKETPQSGTATTGVKTPPAAKEEATAPLKTTDPEVEALNAEAQKNASAKDTGLTPAAEAKSDTAQAKAAAIMAEAEQQTLQIKKAEEDIAEARRLRENAPDTAAPDSGVKTKDYYDKYIEETQQWIDKQQKDKGTEMYSRGESAQDERPLSREELEQYVAELTTAAANTPPFVIVNTQAELPFDAPDDAKGAFHDGKIFLVAESIAGAEDARGVIFHEFTGHFGLRGFFGAALDNALLDIHEHNPLVKKYAAQWKADNADLQQQSGMTDEEYYYRSIEEAMAKMAQENKPFTFADRLLSTIQSLLRNIGMDKLADTLEAKTNAEALTMLHKAGLYIRKGITKDTANIPEPLYPFFIEAKQPMFAVGQKLRETDVPIDDVKPAELDVKGTNKDILTRVAEEYRSWPERITAADGSEILLANPEEGYISKRALHLVWDNEKDMIKTDKARWLPNVPITLAGASIRLVDHKTGNRVYVKAYSNGARHMVVVAPDGVVLEQKPFTGRLVTQFPSAAGTRREGMIIDWERENGEGRSQGNPNPTSPASTSPGSRQGTFQEENIISDENVKEKDFEKNTATPADKPALIEDPDTQLSVEAQAAAFAQQLDDYASGKLRKDIALTAGKTPYVLERLGAKQLPVVISQDAIRKDTKDKHSLSIELLKELPYKLNDPIMVLASKGQNPEGPFKSFVVMTELQHEGKTVIAAIHLDVTEKHHIVNEIASVYGKDSDHWFYEQIEEKRLLYMNRKKSREWFLTRGLYLPKVETAIRGLKRKILFDHDLVKGKDKLSAEAQTGAPRIVGEAQLEELAEQLTKIAKGIKITKKDGVIWLQTKSGDTVRVEAVEEITPASVALTLKKHYAQDKLGGKKIAGMYQPREQKITLVKNVAGIWTLSHEFYHFLEDIGAISNADKLTLNQKINALIARDAKTYGYLKNRSLPERRAEWAGRTLAGAYDATTTTGKILAKIREIIDMIINALGVRTAQGIIRDIKTGEIYQEGNTLDSPATLHTPGMAPGNDNAALDNAAEKPYPYAEGETTDGVSDSRGEDINRGTERTPGIQGFTPTVVGREKAGTLKAASRKITNAGDAAQVAAPYLTKYPDEHIISLVMDAKKNLLHAFAHTTGLRGQSQVSISTLAGDALNTPGAKAIIIAHNHPSGSTKFSVEDKSLHQRLDNLLAGSGVTLLDSLVVTKEHYASYMEDGGYGPDIIPAAAASKTSIPLTRRVFETAEVNEKISSAVDAINMARRYIPQGGALLFNAQNRLAGTLNITDYKKIRGEAQKEMLQALEKHNANAVVIYAPDRIIDPLEAANIKKFFTGATHNEITLLDILDQNGSQMEAGTLPDNSGREFLSVAETAEDITAKVTAAAGRKVSRAVEITTGRMSPETKPTLDKLKKHWREFWQPFSTLADGDKALTARYQAMGNVAKAVRFIDKLKTELDAYPPEVKKDMFWYLNGDIPVEFLPIEAREMAQNIKRRTEIIGEMLVDRGILTQETFDKHKGKYVHYMYAKHIVGEDGEIGIMPSGKLDLAYTLARNPHLTKQQRLELGLIADASVAVPVGMGKALTDIAKFDFLETIANNPEWVWQPSVVRVAIGAKLKEPIHGRTRRYVTMSVGKLVDQVKIYGEMMRTAPSPDVKEIHDTLAAALDRAQTKAQKAPEDFVELPNSRHYGPLAGAYVAKPIADDLKPVMDITADQGALFNTMLQIHRKGMAYFKMGKVALNLPTAMRNVVSNILQQNMRGRSLPNVIKDIISGIESFKAKDKIYEEAFGMGLFNSNWFTAEINDVLNEFRKAETGRWDKVLIALQNIAKKYYGRIDDIAKLSIFKQMRQDGAGIDEAALEAMKWGMDYSLTSRSVKGLRQTIVPFACVDEETEALTQRGWLKYNEIQRGDIALSFSMEKGKLEWKQVNDVFRKQYHGPMLRFKHRCLDMQLTPDHRAVVYRKQRKNYIYSPRKYQIKYACALNTHDAIPVAAPYDGFPKQARYSDTLVQIVAWLVTEGHFKKSCDQVCISQNEGDKAEQIKALLDREFPQGYKMQRIRNKEICFHIHARYGKLLKYMFPDKQLTTEFLLSLTKEQTQLLVDTMIQGDGHLRKKGTWVFVQKNNQTLAVFQMALCLLGISHGFHYRKSRDICQISKRQGQYYELKRTKAQHIDYSGVIWCPSVADNGTWVARKSGQVFITHNTYQYKIASLIAESLIKRPWVLAKFALIYPAAKMLAMSLHDLDDDDWEDLEKQLPAYIKNAGSVMILPWKSPAGHWQWVNMEYFFPWGNYLELFRNAKDLDTGGTMRDLGISNPFLGLFYTGLSARDETGQPPTHPFYGTPIYNQLDPAPLKAAKYLEYVVNTWMPSMFTRQGAAGYTKKALFGQEDRYGRKVTVPQAGARWFGVNVVSVSPEQSRAQISVRLQDMHKEMARINADPARSDKEKEAYQNRFNQAKAKLAEEAPAAILPITKAKGHDPVYDALRNMAAQGILKSSPPSRTIDIHGVPIKMSMEQYRDYLETSSEMARRKLAPTVTAAGWETMPAWRKTKTVDKVITTARKQVRQRIKIQMAREHRDKIIEARRAKRQI